jgi:hypothetical protein
MQANMRATGRSSEEISAALIQLFLNCPAADPDEPGREVDIDEFAHTVVEQRARRDQQRVLEALAKCDQERALAALQAKEDAPAQAMAANDRPNGGPRVPLMEVVDFCVAPSAMLDSGAASSPPTHPTQLSDGGGTGVGGVRSHQTQDTGTEANSSTASQQTHDAGSGANTAPVCDEARNAWVVLGGWIANVANGEGGWTSPDGAHIGAPGSDRR